MSNVNPFSTKGLDVEAQKFICAYEYVVFSVLLLARIASSKPSQASGSAA